MPLSGSGDAGLVATVEGNRVARRGWTRCSGPSERPIETGPDAERGCPAEHGAAGEMQTA